jgi:DNA-dependent RNA polymerase auxiliary subunit epsilon
MDVAFDYWHASVINDYVVDTYTLYFDIDNESKKIKLIKSKRYEHEIDGDILEYDLDFNEYKITESEGFFEIKSKADSVFSDKFSITISEVKQQ